MLKQLPDRPGVTLWDSRYPKQFGTEIRGLECIEAEGSPVAFEVTGFTVSSNAARANVRLLVMQSELDGSLVLAVRKPHITLLRGSQCRYLIHMGSVTGLEQDHIDGSNCTAFGQTAVATSDKMAWSEGGEHGECAEVDWPLKRPLRLHGRVEIINIQESG